MLKKLYGEVPEEKEPENPLLMADKSWQQVFEERVTATKEFRFGYWTYLLMSAFQYCCCCCSNCLQRRCFWCRSRLRSYKKY